MRPNRRGSRLRRIAAGCILVCALIRASVTAQQASGANGADPQFQLLRVASAAPAPARAPVTVAFRDVSLEEALREITRQAGLGISYRPDLPRLDRRVTLQATGMPAAEALLRVLQDSNLELLVAAHGRTLMLRTATPTRNPPACAVGGVVRDAQTSQLLATVDVRLSGGAGRTLTNSDGAFCLARVAAGTYTVEAGLLGYATARADSVQVPGSAAQQLTFSLTPAAIALTDVVVTPGHFGIAHEIINRPETLNREQIETLPQLAEDIYRTVNRLPGIASNEMTAKFNVRGGDDKSVLVLLDGLELFEPYHLKDFDGALSILDVAAVGGVDLTTGGFSAEYGNRLTGVFDLRTTNQLYTRPRTSLGISLSNARIMSQGSFAGGDGMWLFSARRGYLDILLRLIDQAEGVDPRYYDLLGKVVYQLSPKHRLSVRALRAGDSNHLRDDENENEEGEGIIDSRYGSTYAWLTWQADWSERLRVTTQLATGRLDWSRDALQTGTDNDFAVRDERNFTFLGGKQDWVASISDRFALKWGIELRSGTSKYDYFNWVRRERLENNRVVVSVDTSISEVAPEGTDFGAYIAQRVRPWNALTLETGLRWDRQTHSDGQQLSPRINLALALGARTTLRAAWGRYAQPQALYQLHVQDGEETFSPSERAEQFVAGLEHNLGAGLSARVEAYRRQESDLRPRYRNLSGVIEPVAEAEPDRVRLDPEDGLAQGLEFFLQKHGARSSWSASYAQARAVDVVNGVELPRPLDQRHTFYVDYSFAPAPAWRLSASWQYHSGWPITDAEFRVDSVIGGALFFTRTYGEPYALRLPAYHRMDLRVTRDFALKRGRLSVFLDVFNLYDRENPQSYNYSLRFNPAGLFKDRTIEPLLPRLPTIGATWEF